MIKTIKEFKEFIVWAKKEGLREVKIGEFEFFVSDYEIAKNVVNEATYESSPDSQASIKPPSRADHLKKLSEENEAKKEEEELKFWSSMP